jgi:hypothetical protein
MPYAYIYPESGENYRAFGYGNLNEKKREICPLVFISFEPLPTNRVKELFG